LEKLGKSVAGGDDADDDDDIAPWFDEVVTPKRPPAGHKPQPDVVPPTVAMTPKKPKVVIPEPEPEIPTVTTTTADEPEIPGTPPVSKLKTTETINTLYNISLNEGEAEALMKRVAKNWSKYKIEHFVIAIREQRTRFYTSLKQEKTRDTSLRSHVTKSIAPFMQRLDDIWSAGGE
jgi:hypothetical protein